jgi:Uma2 family endonuclease
MSTRLGLITANELLHMPDNGMRRELVAGKLREMTPSGHEHGFVTLHMTGPLYAFVMENNLGAVFAAETGFLLTTDPDTVRAPDVAFVARERYASLSKTKGYFPGPPDLAVEVISPNDTYGEVEEKVEAWLSSGCRVVVVVNPRNQTLKVYRSTTEVTLLTVADSFQCADLLPGFELPFSKIIR